LNAKPSPGGKAASSMPASSNGIFATGEMAELTRAFDWSRTPVGPIEQWPDTLLVTVNTLLATCHPMFLWWGTELTQFYNDAYRPSIRSDKHPKALGQAGRECWPEIWPIIGPQIEAVMTRGESTWHEDQLIPIYRDGKLEDVYWTYSYSPVRGPDGAIRGTLVTCSETTGRVLAEQQLRVSQERYKALFELGSDAVFIADIEGTISEANVAASKLLGYDQEQLLGRNYAEIVAESEVSRLWRTRDRLLKGGVSVEEWQLTRPDGSTLIAEVSASILPDGRWQAFARDITEQKRAAATLLQSEKLAAVGRLASSIAHEINNPLEAITNLLYLSERVVTSPEAKVYLASAQQELARVSNIATQTLRFHRQSTNPRETSLQELLDSVFTLFQGRINTARISVERQYRTSCRIMAFSGDLRQVFANMISNALDATRKGGRIVVRVRDCCEWSGEYGVRVTIADDGVGMSTETRRRLFEPFFTTKSATGTGLGLWVSSEILNNHHARVRVRSSQSGERHGTVFSIFFPLNAAGE
jgi:PAS domain S-box-containing protein